jgi:hexosaminidase
MRYLLFLIILFSCGSPKKSDINLIPKPQKIEINNNSFTLSKNTHIITDSLFINESKYLKKLLQNPLNGSGNSIVLGKVNDLKTEEYYLDISSNQLKIMATYPEGIMRGIQTLRQLLPLRFEEKGGEAEIQCLTIHDFPAFKWRGMLLDCCRHFMEKDFVKRYIDLLAYHKMNTLHWHLTEDQGWRIEIDKYPNLTKNGAWRVEETGEVYGGFYTKDDIREIISYAEERHITIVPEIEFPGHSVAAISSYPFLSCNKDSIKVGNQWGVYKDIYCAGDERTFTFMEDILTEVIDLFPSEYIHIGGDEAPKYRWDNCVNCQRRIKDEKLHDTHELQSYFIKRIERFLNEKGKKLIGWDEILEGGLAPSATDQSWRGENGGILAAKNGHDAIMSPTSHCYFDYGLDAINMEKVYSYDPIPKALNKHEAKHILGAECNMWTEHAPQETIDSKVFPRILAISEVLWNYGEKNYPEFYDRVQNHYLRLDDLGVNYGFESIPIKSEIEYQNNHFRVNLIPGNKNMKLEYSIDSLNWNKYLTPFTIEKSCTIYARGLDSQNNYTYFSQPIVKSKSTGKKVEYIIPYSTDYIGKGDLNLTDGLLGGNKNFRDGYYQGFSGTNFEVIIDLGKITNFSEIHTSFYQYHLSWIILPSSVKYSISDDKINFIEIKVIKNNISLMKEGKFKHNFSIENINLNGRYIKVKAKNVGKLPNEHPAAGSDSWIFVDEIIIK